MDQEFTLRYRVVSSEKELHAADQQLVSAAKTARSRAYAPYSGFQVGAALRLENGQIIEGNNQENIAYPSGLCAERVALFYAGASFPDLAIESICIVVQGDLIAAQNAVSPCGSCRQVMLESEARQASPIRVLLVQKNGQIFVLNSCKDLLPFGFMK
ncbi:MAG: cytidine deaminase [Flavobacteriales bacterium]